MKKKYEVKWANVAEKDLADIIEYISHDSPSRALEILREIKEKASNLYHTPEWDRVVPELQKQGILKYRELIIPPWRLI